MNTPPVQNFQPQCCIGHLHSYLFRLPIEGIGLRIHSLTVIDISHAAIRPPQPPGISTLFHQCLYPLEDVQRLPRLPMILIKDAAAVVLAPRLPKDIACPMEIVDDRPQQGVAGRHLSVTALRLHRQQPMAHAVALPQVRRRDTLQQAEGTVGVQVHHTVGFGHPSGIVGMGTGGPQQDCQQAQGIEGLHRIINK